MRVTEAGVELAAYHQRTESFALRERLELARQAASSGVVVSLSDAAQARAASDSIRQAAEDAVNDPRLALLAALFERLTGRPLLVLRPGCRHACEPSPETTGPAAATARPLAFAVGYELTAEHRLAESVRFEARALVRTADGREIAVRIGFELSRETVERLNLQVGIGRQPPPKDPLVLNFAGSSAQLTEGRFPFDLDADGTPEAMPFLASGSAFLAIDRNGDGIVNDGRELFGPATGDGFRELAALDADGNGFIDEADPSFARLLLFNRSAAGDWVLPLAQAGVGALYVGRAATPFDLGAGLLRASSFYLTAAGSGGTLQQVDLKV